MNDGAVRPERVGSSVRGQMSPFEVRLRPFDEASTIFNVMLVNAFSKGREL